MKLHHFAALALATSSLISTSAMAAGASDTGYLTGTLGWYDFSQQDNQASQFGVEYRFTPVEYGLRPTIGAFVTSDEAAYGYVGINWDIALMPNQLYVIPNFAAGVYTAGDEGKRLGGAIEFRSGIELAYQMANLQRVGLAFNHISNASIYKRNPGVETLMVTYSVPTGKLF